MVDCEVEVLAWVRGSDDEIHSGLLGYIRVAYGSLVLDGITMRKTSDGRFALSFPARTDRAGRRHAFVRPADDTARRAIEREILEQLGQRPDLVERLETGDG